MYDKSFALVIGVVNYTPGTGWSNLPYVTEEIKLVDSELRKQGFQTTTIIDPTFDDLNRAIRNFFTKNWPRDVRLVLYFAGHGHTDRNEQMGYIVPADAPRVDDSNFFGRVMSMSEIQSLLPKGKRAKHVFLMFNSCFSGSIFLTRKNILPPDVVELGDIDRPTWQYLTAGAEDEEVPDDGVFSNAVVQGLRGDADANQDGLVTGKELGYYVENEGKSEDSHPKFGVGKGDRRLGDMVFLNQRTNNSGNLVVAANPPDGIGPRETLLRGLSLPKNNDTVDPVFDRVEVLYYRSPYEGDKVTNILDNSKIPYTIDQTQNRQRFESDTIVCARDTPIDALKFLAKSMINGGAQLVRIRKILDSKDKPRRLELTRSTSESPTSQFRGYPLTIQQIDELETCPSFLQN